MRPATSHSAFRYPLSSVLRTEASVRVLRELALHGGALDTTRLIRGTGLTRQTVLAALDHLVATQLARFVGSGHSRPAQLNLAHPIAPALVGLFQAEAARVERVFGAIRGHASTTRARAVWLYGSVARGSDAVTSDFDLAVVAGGEGATDARTEAFRNGLRDVEARECVTISVVGIDDEDVARLAAGDPWWVALARDAIPIVGDRPDDYARRLGRTRAAGDSSGSAKARRARGR